MAVVFRLGLAALGLSALVGFWTTHVADARLYEQARQEEHDQIKRRYEELKQQDQSAQPAAAATAEDGRELASESEGAIPASMITRSKAAASSRRRAVILTSVKQLNLCVADNGRSVSPESSATTAASASVPFAETDSCQPCEKSSPSFGPNSG